MTERCGFTALTGPRVLLLALLLACFGGSAWAQDEQGSDEDDSATLNRITVTGSRIKRTEMEGPAPVIVIDRLEMSERGYTTVFEALSDLTINNGFKFEGAESALFTPDVQTINLRGFGVGTTLTLINGRRLTNYPAAYQSNATVFSYGSIPVAAIERIEILSTSASAIYGSDAVAGVVNIILRSNIDETTVNVLWGTPTETKSTRNDIRLQVVNGKTFDRGSYTLTAEYSKRDGIQGRHYDEYDDQQDDFPYGEGFYNRDILTLDWFKAAFGVFPRYRDPGEILGTSGQAACDASGAGLAYSSRPGAGYFCGDPQTGVAETNFRNERESLSLYFNGKYEIGDSGTELFTDLLYYKGESSSYSRNIGVFEDILDLTKPDTVGFGFFDWYLAQRQWNDEELGMDLSEQFEDEAYTMVFGARGYLGDSHDWEASVNWSEYTYESERPWLKWRETIDNMLGAWLGVGFFGDDWWGGGILDPGVSAGLGNPNNLYGPPSQGVRDAIGMQSYGNKTEDLFLQFAMSGDLLEMNAGPLSYAFVAEYEDESLKFIPDELIQQAPPTTDSLGGPITGLTGSGWYRLTGYDGEGDRQRWSLGGELRIPLHPTLTVNLAARWDDYDSGSTSFGGDITPSASIEWRPLDNLLLRAGYTESFRAPDMAQVFVRTGFFTGATDFISCYEQYVFINGTDEGFNVGDCDGTTIFARRVGAQDFGGDPLDAETGDNLWLGFSWDITENFNLTVDYTKLRLENRVLQQSTQGLLDDEYACFTGQSPQNTPCDLVEQQIRRKVDPTTGISFIDEFFVTSINQFEEEGEYLDVRLIYNLNTKYGGFRFQGDYNNVLSHTQRLTSDSEESNLKSDPFVGGWDFRSSFIGSVTWSYRDFTTTVTGVYRGATTIWRPVSNPVGSITGENYIETENWWIDPYITWNWTASYNFTDDLLARVRVVNVFDEEPPFDDTFLAFDNPWYNIYVYPGAAIGRFAALEMEFTF